jgi:putative intracellular protease/amidase
VSASVAVLIFDGFADWEPAFAMTGLRQWGRRAVTTVGYDRHPITSMGGLRVVPDRSIDELRADETELLLLPGGDAWAAGYPADRLHPVLTSLAAQRIPIAAICGATIAAARAGLFRDRRHTSNSRSFLQQHAPGYETASAYVDAPAVSDDGVISASGLGAVEFAREIFARLGVFDDVDLERYMAMYRHGRGLTD